MSLLRVFSVSVILFSVQASMIAATREHAQPTTIDPTISAPWKQDATERFNGADVVARQVIVKFKALPDLSKAYAADARQHSISEVVKNEDILRHRPVGGTGAELFESRSKDVGTLVNEIASRGDVEYVEPDYRGRQLDTIPNDPFFGQLWALQNTGQVIDNTPPGTPGADIGAVKAWDITTGSTANVVAIIDSGIWPGHPDLVNNLWSSPKAFTVNIGGTQFNCVVGAEGFDTLDKPESCLTSNLADNFNGHGTFVAGIIGAKGNNSTGIVGVNWITSMMIVRAISSSGGLNTSDAIDAINFVIQAKQAGAANVRAINASWETSDFLPSQALFNEITAANSNNILFVAAAGNSGNNNDQNPVWPANFGAPSCKFPGGTSCYAPNVVSVAMTDNQDLLDQASDYGPTTVHLGAPGVRIFSTVLNNGYDFLGPTRGTGTSAAAPQVTGSAALVLSHCPGLNTADLKADILNTVDLKPSLQGKTITGGRLNVNSAVRYMWTGTTKLAGAGANGGGTEPPWVNPGNVSSKTNYATDQASFTQLDKATQFGFNVPAGKTIEGIQVSIVASGGCGPRFACLFQLSLLKNGTVVGTSKSTRVSTLTTYIFGGPCDLWGAPFAPGDVNTNSFGVAISAFHSGVGGGLYSMDDVQITVFTN